MPRSRLIVTTDWQQANTGLSCVLTVDKMVRRGYIEFNDTPTGDTTLKTLVNVNYQFWQCEDKAVWVRSDLQGFELVIDERAPTP